MFQPISFNVIRQALEWHGVPIPKLRQLSLDDSDPDFIVGEYMATWAEEQFVAVLHPDKPGYQIGDMLNFTHKVRECFCEDIKVFAQESELWECGVRLLLYVAVPRTTLAWWECFDAINA